MNHLKDDSLILLLVSVFAIVFGLLTIIKGSYKHYHDTGIDITGDREYTGWLARLVGFCSALAGLGTLWLYFNGSFDFKID